jgi:hypothetical protein
MSVDQEETKILRRILELQEDIAWSCALAPPSGQASPVEKSVLLLESTGEYRRLLRELRRLRLAREGREVAQDEELGEAVEREPVPV